MPEDIIFSDHNFVIIDKPYGHYVHPPENDFPVHRSLILLYRVRDHFGKHVYPVHRLDVSTTGLLIFAFSPKIAAEFQKIWHTNLIKKSYKAVVRGWAPAMDTIRSPLKSDGHGDLQEAITHYKKIAQVELPFSIGKRHSTSRYSLLEVSLETGRWHQIRRHLARASYPLIGDGTHGDSRHNVFFRETLGLEGLCLRAQTLSFPHPETQQHVVFNAPETPKWRKIQLLFENFDEYIKQV